jgi:hypothetical protein
MGEQRDSKEQGDTVHHAAKFASAWAFADVMENVTPRYKTTDDQRSVPMLPT